MGSTREDPTRLLGPTKSATPLKLSSSPATTRAPGRVPPGRSQSMRTIHNETVATSSAATPEGTVRSGVAALLVATVSLWMVLIDWLRPGGTRPGARVVAGLLLSFSGVALLVGPNNLVGSSRVDPVGVGLLVVASLAWAAGSVYSKHAGGLSGS